jgi:hypothetical protein
MASHAVLIAEAALLARVVPASRPAARAFDPDPEPLDAATDGVTRGPLISHQIPPVPPPEATKTKVFSGAAQPQKVRLPVGYGFNLHLASATK